MSNLQALRTIEAAAAAVANLPLVGANAYANGMYRRDPIVSKHFTSGNQARYAWAHLSPGYALWKLGATRTIKATIKQSGNAVPRGALPMLVLSGKMKAAVLSRNHRIQLEGDVAVITFGHLPAYALAHHQGNAKLPRRSPVAPNSIDLEEIRAEMAKYLDASLGTGGTVPQSLGWVPGTARTIK